jgi:hypothetical protein
MNNQTKKSSRRHCVRFVHHIATRIHLSFAQQITRQPGNTVIACRIVRIVSTRIRTFARPLSALIDLLEVSHPHFRRKLPVAHHLIIETNPSERKYRYA